MANPFIAQISLFPFNFPPKGWALCEGQLMPISQNTALFALLGTIYGGNGTSNFALPDLQGRVPNNQGQGPGLSLYDIGESAGSEEVTLLSTQMPAHRHAMFGMPASATSASPSGNLLAMGHGSGRGGAFNVNDYAAGVGNTKLSSQTVGIAGGSQPHNNLQPYLTLNFCIALQGVFPARS